jgi:hydroxymethylglutaryl-CoA reductase
MELHARNVAVTAGARPDEIEAVVARLVAEHAIRFDRAKEIVAELRRADAQ